MRDLCMKKPSSVLPLSTPASLVRCQPSDRHLKLLSQSDLSSVEGSPSARGSSRCRLNQASGNKASLPIYSEHQDCYYQRSQRSGSWSAPTLGIAHSSGLCQQRDSKCLLGQQQRTKSALVESERRLDGGNCWSDGASTVLDCTVDDPLDESSIDEDVFLSPTTVNSSSSASTTDPVYRSARNYDGLDCFQSDIPDQSPRFCCYDRIHSLQEGEDNNLKSESIDEPKESECNRPNSMPSTHSASLGDGSVCTQPFLAAIAHTDRYDALPWRRLDTCSTSTGGSSQNTALSTDSSDCHMPEKSCTSCVYQANPKVNDLSLTLYDVHQLALGGFSSAPLFTHCIHQSRLKSKLDMAVPKACRKLNLFMCNAKRNDDLLWRSQLTHSFPCMLCGISTSMELVQSLRLPWHPESRQRRSVPVSQSISCFRDSFQTTGGSVQELRNSTFDSSAEAPRKHLVLRKGESRRTETPSSAPAAAGVFDFSDTDYLRTWLTPAEASRLPVKRSPPPPDPDSSATEQRRGGSRGDIICSIVSAKPSKLFHHKKNREVAYCPTSRLVQRQQPRHHHFSRTVSGDPSDVFGTPAFPQQTTGYPGFQSYPMTSQGLGVHAHMQYRHPQQQPYLPTAYPNYLLPSSSSTVLSTHSSCSSNGYQDLWRPPPYIVSSNICRYGCCPTGMSDPFTVAATAPNGCGDACDQSPSTSTAANTPTQQPVFLDLTGCDITLSVEQLPPFHPDSPPLRAHHRKKPVPSRYNPMPYTTAPETQYSFGEQSPAGHAEICFSSTPPVTHFLQSTPSHMCDCFVSSTTTQWNHCSLCYSQPVPAYSPPPYSATVGSSNGTSLASEEANSSSGSSSFSSPQLSFEGQLTPPDLASYQGPCSPDMCPLVPQLCTCCPQASELASWSTGYAQQSGYLFSPSPPTPMITAVSHFHPAAADSSTEKEEPVFFPPTPCPCPGDTTTPHQNITYFRHPCGITCSPCRTTHDGSIVVHSQPMDSRSAVAAGSSGYLPPGRQMHQGCWAAPLGPEAGDQRPEARPNWGWVCVPEPIRVSRSQDVYNALRTCLVPHYALREFAFTLMCYNILSPNYATASMFPYCPSWALNWDYRRRAILDEIRVYHANIICLQEVETNQFEEIFKPELEKLNYDAVFLPKSRRRTMGMKECKRVDGCAIFWQTDKFEKLHEFHHEFMLSCSSMCENPTALMLNRVMTRDNVALGVIFETKGAPGPDGPGGRQFCVTTGHIHWDPDYSDVKMIQTILWTAELWAYIDQFLTGSGTDSASSSSSSSSSSEGSRTSPPGGGGSGTPAAGGTPAGGYRSTPLSSRLPVPGPSSPAANMPVILCGDLNSLANSGVIEFLMRGSLPKSHTDFRNNGNDYMFEDWRLLEKWALDGDIVRHRFALDRAYQPHQGMQITNYTYEFRGMIDYVFFTRQHFRTLGSLDQIQESWFSEKKIMGCPHVHIPSDHFALLVELELQPTPLLTSSSMSTLTTTTGMPGAASASRLAKPTGRNRCRSEGPGFLGGGHVSRNSTAAAAGATVAAGSSASPGDWPDPATTGSNNRDGGGGGGGGGNSELNASTAGPAGSTSSAKHRRR